MYNSPVTDWIKFVYSDEVNSVYRRIGNTIEIRHESALDYHGQNDYPSGLKIIPSTKTIDYEKKRCEATFFLGWPIKEHTIFVTKIKAQVEGWENKVIQFEPTLSQNYEVKFDFNKVTYDTHKIYDASRNRVTAIFNGELSFSLTFDKPTKGSWYKNYSSLDETKGIPIASDSLNTINYRISELRAGDVIDFVFDNDILNGRMNLIPYATNKPRIDNTQENLVTNNDVEYLGHIVKINTPGVYEITTKNGKLNLKLKK